MAGEGELLSVLGLTQIIKLGAEDTDGAFTLLDDRVPPGLRVPLHRHRSHSETFCILEGGAEIRVGDRKVDARPGMTIHIPKGVPHAVSSGEQGMHMLTTIEPAGMEGMCRELSALAPGPPDPEAVREIAARYDTDFLEPLEF